MEASSAVVVAAVVAGSVVERVTEVEVAGLRWNPRWGSQGRDHRVGWGSHGRHRFSLGSRGVCSVGFTGPAAGVAMCQRGCQRAAE